MIPRKYKPVIFANHELNVPELNWQTSISVDYFNFNDTTPYKVFWQLEPEEVSHVEAKLIKNHKFYDLILTFNAAVLDCCSNAVLFPVTSLWTHEKDTSQKKFAASFLTSDKYDTYGHKFRVGTFIALKRWLENEVLDAKERPTGAWGRDTLPLPVKLHMSPPYLAYKDSMLIPFQYAIAIQNSQQHNYFSEILLDCFATKTIPIFWGCANIGDFFNTNGMVIFSDASCDSTNAARLIECLSCLTPERYHSARVQAAIEDNYLRAIKYQDRIGLLIKAISDSWEPKIGKVHRGHPNAEIKI